MSDTWREATDYAHYCGHGPTDDPPAPDEEEQEQDSGEDEDS